MRYLFGFLCVCALGLTPLVGCSETSGEGGSGGSAGEGGSGGAAGSGGMPECEAAEDCDDGNECTGNACVGAACEYAPVQDGTACDERNECNVGTCAEGTCDTTSVQDGTACGDGAGTCEAGSCVGTFACTEQGILDAIAVGGGPHTFTCDGPTTVVTLDEIVIDNDVILDGEDNLTVDGNETHFVFYVPEGMTAQLRGLTMTRGGLSVVVNLGTLSLTSATVSDGACPSDGCMPVGIENHGTMTLTNSTVSGNTIGILSDETMTLTNSTVSASHYGIVNALGTMTLTHCTVSGLGIVSQEALTTLTNSIVVGNCDGDVVSNGYNIESPNDRCGFDQTGDLVNITEGQLNLGELANNGGPTMTHALGADSVAIDHIPEVDCKVNEDQRGFPRDSMCDVGAFEVQPPPAEGCTQSGGTVSTALCCQAVESFPNTCTIGACGCAPDASHEVAFCICPTNTCFDGESCVAQ